MAELDKDKSQALVDKARTQRQQLGSGGGEGRVPALIALAVLGGIGLLLALVVGASSNEAPTCGGNTMTRDDRCVIHSGGGSDSHSYQEMTDREQTTDTVIRWFGWCLAGPCAVLLIVAALPSPPWGTKVATPCPRCGGTELRQQKITHGARTGVVALCTPACGYASVEGP